MKQQKKADFILGEFGVKLVIGVLCLAALILIAVYISKLFTEQTQTKQAEATVKEIAIQIDYLRKIQAEEIGYDYRSPSDWYIYQGTNQGVGYLCICPRDSYESCKEGSCVPVKSIVIGEDVLHAPMASKNAEVLKLEKLKDDKGTLAVNNNLVVINITKQK